MKSSAFFRLSAGVVMLSLLVFSGLATSVQAGNPAQATMASTMSASQCAPMGMATSSAMMSSTMDSGMMAATMAAGTGTGVGYLGVEVAAVDDCGVRVTQTFSGSPASTTLKAGDIIVAVNCSWLGSMSGNMSMMATPDMTDCTGMMSMGATMSASSAMGSATMMPTMSAGMTPIAGFFAAVESHHSGDTVTLTVIRAGAWLNVQVTLGTLPPGVKPYSAGTMMATMVATP